MFSKHDSQSTPAAFSTRQPDLIEPRKPGIAAAALAVRDNARSLVIASILVAAVSTSALTVHFAGAEGVNQTGPNGGQCHLKTMGGDFVDPGNDDTTNNSNITLSPVTGSPDGTGPQMTPAGCSLTTSLPPPPIPSPTPIPPPPHHITLQNTTGARQLN